MRCVVPGIYLDSNYHAVEGNRARLRVSFPKPIRLAPEKRYYMRILRGSIPMTVNPNISANNNTIRYSVNGGGAWKTITFDTGVWDFQGLNDKIYATLVSNGDYTVVSGNIEVAFALSVEKYTSFSYNNINPNYANKLLTIVDLTNNSTSLFYQLYGFTVGEAILDGSVKLEQKSSGYADIYDSQFVIGVDVCRSMTITSTGDAIGQAVDSGDIIYLGYLNGVLGGKKFIDAIEDIYAIIRDMTVINEITVELRNRDNKTLLSFFETSTDSNVSFTLAIYE